MQWFWDSTRGIAEASELKERFLTLDLLLDREQKSATARGKVFVADGIGFATLLELPDDYPAGVPILRCDPKEIPWKPDRHANEQTGEGCLCVRSEYRIHWPFGSSLATFIERLVVPYFIGQFYYDTHGCWPPTGHRSHGPPGIIEAYVDLTAQLGNSSTETIERLMRLLARKAHPKGHELCPCGSMKPLRKCHGEVIRNLRRNVAPQDAVADLAHTFQSSFSRRPASQRH
jgi:hypothetical protein